MGSTTSCRAPCFQWAIAAPLDGSEAMRTGAVLSTRTISASAGRRSAPGKSRWCASEVSGGFSCERSRKIDLHLMDLSSRLGGTSFEHSARVLGAVQVLRLSQSRHALPDLAASRHHGRACDQSRNQVRRTVAACCYRKRQSTPGDAFASGNEWTTALTLGYRALCHRTDTVQFDEETRRPRANPR